MAIKPKAREPAREDKGKKEDQKQAERFIETARQHDADESGEEFERRFRRIIPPKSRERSEQ